MDLDNLKSKAEELAKDLAGDEAKTDSVLDALADAAKKATGGKFGEQIDAARNAADEKLGE